MNKTILSPVAVYNLAASLADCLQRKFLNTGIIQPIKSNGVITAYPVPRGGIPALFALMAIRSEIRIAYTPNEADFIMDDIIDSGSTRQRYAERFPDKPFLALVDKTDAAEDSGWVVFPWESNDEKDDSLADNVTRILQQVGEDPEREGLKETPQRVAKAWGYWCGGYDVNIPRLMKQFTDGAPVNADEMVIVKNIPFYSKCEHHMADIFGTATVAYIPGMQVVGLSKISRLVDAYARRLQVQERLTNQIADAMNEHLKPLGVGVIIKARHMCMESRGICQQGHHTVTSALRGVIKTSPQARAEFIQLSGD